MKPNQHVRNLIMIIIMKPNASDEAVHKITAVIEDRGLQVHPNPACVLSDGPQSLTFEQFDQLTTMLHPYAELEGRSF